MLETYENIVKVFSDDQVIATDSIDVIVNKIRVCIDVNVICCFCCKKSLTIKIYNTGETIKDLRISLIFDKVPEIFISGMSDDCICIKKHTMQFTIDEIEADSKHKIQFCVQHKHRINALVIVDGMYYQKISI